MVELKSIDKPSAILISVIDLFNSLNKLDSEDRDRAASLLKRCFCESIFEEVFAGGLINYVKYLSDRKGE